MPGPAPKPAATRQRRNTTATTASLVARPARLPARLPDRTEEGPTWHPLTERWWRELRRSPMVAEYVQFDVEGLLRLAHVVDKANRDPGDLKTEETIARLGALYGLTPIDRRRLDWRIERPSSAKATTRETAPPPTGSDPRTVLLRAVQ